MATTPRSSARRASSSSSHKPPVSATPVCHWTQQDEVALLHALLNHMETSGASSIPSSPSEVAPFVDLLRGTLSFSVPRPRSISDKLRRLRHKYVSCVPSGGWSTAHDIAVSELVEQIWGSGERKRKRSDDDVTNEDEEEERLAGDNDDEVYYFLNKSVSTCKAVSQMGDFSVRLMEEGIGLLEKSKAKELDEEWKEVWEMENKVSRMRAKLIRKQERMTKKAIETARTYC
ncbi:hypothetical protein QJS10_CPB13g01150 [Acorus calamus]|uniref:Glabrous enhancer-binding protein-like DBD domain-containing protein n=1 Tax=Acorus calamus TaxID=4465 RepID=A0AAV9DII3_ACOCL|nr:hypothetical protein QJS10_CPB13g01150 [Acorus calamus]